jgi:hypothetical protein
MSFIILDAISEYSISAGTKSFDFYSVSAAEYDTLRDAAPIVAIVCATSRSLLSSIAPRFGTKKASTWMRNDELLRATNQTQEHSLSKIYWRSEFYSRSAGDDGADAVVASRKRRAIRNSNSHERTHFLNFTTQEERKNSSGRRNERKGRKINNLGNE